MKISVLMASKGNEANLTNSIGSLFNNCYDARNFELLVKTDEEDIIPFIPMARSHIVTPRARGLADLHKSYNDLFAISSPESELFMVLSDDAAITLKNWDIHLLAIAEQNKGRPYVINTTTLVTEPWESEAHAIGLLDIYPVWSKSWLSLSGFGFSFGTDSWTSLLSYNLEACYGVDRNDYRYLVDLGIVRNEIGDDDNEERAEIIKEQTKLLLSKQVGSIANIKARAIASAIRN